MKSSDKLTVETAFLLTAVAFGLGTLGYEAMKFLGGHGFPGLAEPFPSLKGYNYHRDYPHHYIGLMAIVYGGMGAVWSNWFGYYSGGILWTIHDMQAGFVPSGRQFWINLGGGAKRGLFLGWYILAHATPYNITGLVAGSVTLHFVSRWKNRRNRPDPETGFAN